MRNVASALGRRSVARRRGSWLAPREPRPTTARPRATVDGSGDDGHRLRRQRQLPHGPHRTEAASAARAASTSAAPSCSAGPARTRPTRAARRAAAARAARPQNASGEMHRATATATSRATRPSSRDRATRPGCECPSGQIVCGNVLPAVLHRHRLPRSPALQRRRVRRLPGRLGRLQQQPARRLRDAPQLDEQLRTRAATRAAATSACGFLAFGGESCKSSGNSFLVRLLRTNPSSK